MDIFKFIRIYWFVSKKWLIVSGFFLTGFLTALSASASIAIDGFNSGGGDDYLNPGDTAWRNAQKGIGGERETECHADAANAGNYPVTCGMSTLNALLLGITDNGDSAYFNVIWDGSQKVKDTYVNDLGLSEDFTGGDENVIRLIFSSNNPNETGSISICFYTSLVDFSCKDIANVPATLGGAGITNYKIWDFLYSDFISDAGGSGADFSNIKAIELRMTAHDAIILGVDKLSAESEIQSDVNYALVTDNNGDGDIDSGDVVEYTVTLTNTDDYSDRDVTNLIYSANIDANATLIPQTVTTSAGTITSGNGPSDTSVSVDVGTLADAASVTIKYKVMIDSSVADGTSYTHHGNISADNNINTTTTVTNDSASNDTFTINAFDMTDIMTVAALDDADNDSFAGPGERVTFTANVTNNSSIGQKYYFWQYDISNADIGGINFPSGFVDLSGLCSGCLKLDRSAASLTGGASENIMFKATIHQPFPYNQFGSTPAYIEAQSIITDRSGVFTDSDYLNSINFEFSDDNTANEMDYTRILVDAFPNNIAASVDNDNDGLPDEWNDISICDATCRSNSGLTLDPYLNDTNNNGTPNSSDPDIDGDGVVNASDAFPYIFAASVDSDGDGKPDAWTAGCDTTCQNNSGLTLDDDRDGDGVSNTLDPFPDDPSVDVDTDGDGLADDWASTCDLSCQNASSQVLDTDDDNDGVPDVDDAFPLDSSVATDTDGDGFADDWVASCDAACQSASSQVLDDNDDNDEALDVDDAWPLNKYAYDDADKDGMPDSWSASSGCDTSNLQDPSGCEYLSGLTEDPYPTDTDNDGVPNNPSDPNADDDGDGILNGADTDNFHDDLAPVVTAPADISVKSTGSLTAVDLGSASAVDYLDGSVTASADNTGPFAVGVYTITWSASDAAGNVGTDTQQVTITSGGGGGGGGSFGYLILLCVPFLFTRKNFYEK